MKPGLVAHDRVALAASVRRTEGLVAPKPPPAGALTPNGTGWLIGVGSVGRRVRPRLWRWVDRSGALAGFGPWLAYLLSLDRPGILAVLGLGAVPPLAVLAAARLFVRTSLDRRMDAAEPLDLARTPPGRFVRVRGHIAEQATAPTLFRGVPAVLFRNRIGAADETRGLDFVLETAGGRLKIGARDAILLDEPRRTREPPACGPVHCDPWADGTLTSYAARLCSSIFVAPSPLLQLMSHRRFESSVAPGDEVEVFGILHHEADPDDAAGSFAREVPVSRVLRAGALPLLVRGIARR